MVSKKSKGDPAMPRDDRKKSEEFERFEEPRREADPRSCTGWCT